MDKKQLQIFSQSEIENKNVMNLKKEKPVCTKPIMSNFQSKNKFNKKKKIQLPKIYLCNYCNKKKAKVKKCTYCKKYFCFECDLSFAQHDETLDKWVRKKCSKCKNIYCTKCFEENFTFCNFFFDDEQLCDKCAIKCDNCKENFCDKCTRQCNKCKKRFCLSCFMKNEEFEKKYILKVSNDVGFSFYSRRKKCDIDESDFEMCHECKKFK